MTSSRSVHWLALLLAFACGFARALPPDQVYDRVSPSLWSVRALDAAEKLLASASGVVVAPGRLVTSCQVLARAQQVQLRRGNLIYDAKLEFPDVERDLCQLSAPGLAAPAPAYGSARTLRPGQRVYVIGYARANEQSISDGLVSAVRDAGTAGERIQTSVPAARGLLGAGLFDEDGRLVGLVTSSAKDAANATFAVPVEWLAELEARGGAVLAKRTQGGGAQGAAATPGIPAVGTSWRYGFVERQYSRRQSEFVVRAVRADANEVQESLSFGADAPNTVRRVFHVREQRFARHTIGPNATLVELSPYLLAGTGGSAPQDLARPAGYAGANPGLHDWDVKVRVHDWEQVAVPAGAFRALRVEASGTQRGGFSGVARFTLNLWYAPEAQRYVKLEHRVWGFNGAPAGDDMVELLEYRVN